MREVSLKATFINLLLLAVADGKMHPAEAAYLRRFAKVSGISEDQERRWKWEMESQKLGFQNIEDKKDAEEAVALMARQTPHPLSGSACASIAQIGASIRPGIPSIRPEPPSIR